MLEEKFYKIWITLIENLGIKRYSNLIQKFKTRKNIFYASKKELMQVKLMNETICNHILEEEKRKLAKRHLLYMEQNKIDIISIEDEEYPPNLKEIYNPPICLYSKGNNKTLKKIGIGIVGARECSHYGKEIAQRFSYELVSHQINIVSGLAKGIDSYAHLGAIYGKGITVAILGNGIDLIYPKENQYLAKKIIETGGVLLTEYPIGTPPNRMNFPARNRIISGMTDGILVIEAKQKSGTLITVDFALEQGRNVFAIPRKY